MVKMCQVLVASKSGYYDWLKRPTTVEWLERQEEREKLNRAILEIFHGSYGTYGSPRIHKELIRRGFEVCQKTVAIRMKELNLTALPPKRKVATMDSNHSQTVHPNVVARDFKTVELNKVWVADITYIRHLDGWSYLASIMDLCSRKIIAYTLGDTMETELPLSALRKALAIRQPKDGVIHHSDRGSQYCSNVYTKKLTDNRAVISMSRKGDPWDNACIESFHATLKKELIYRLGRVTREEAEKAVRNYIDNFYNTVRIHSSLGYLSPVEFELQKIWEDLSA
ncbi:IS3 family transposase [Bhargavaea ginsengi]|nr:IS3 family transposase [Bhargavaea ginsengi]